MGPLPGVGKVSPDAKRSAPFDLGAPLGEQAEQPEHGLGTLYINTLKSVGRLHGQLNTLSYHNSHYYLFVVLPTPSNHIGLVLSSPYPALLTRGPKSTLGTRDIFLINIKILFIKISNFDTMLFSLIKHIMFI